MINLPIAWTVGFTYLHRDEVYHAYSSFIQNLSGIRWQLTLPEAHWGYCYFRTPVNIEAWA